MNDMATISCYMGKQMFMDLKGPFNLINERKEDKYAFRELNYEF